MKLFVASLFIIATADCWNAEGNVTSVGQVQPNHLTRIVGGHDAERCELTYQVSLQNIENYPGIIYCGGTIIDKNWILTAGHCVYDDISHPEYFQVTTGEYELSANDGTEQTFSVSKIYVHEKYNPETYSYDIALLKLSTPIQFDDCSNKIPFQKTNHSTLEDTKPSTSGNCTISGWGNVQEGGMTSDTLQRATIPFISQEECKQIHDLEQFIDDSMICAGSLTGGTGYCYVDSGGPLVCNNAGTNYLAGVVSWGIGCAREGFPGVYQDVSKHIEWIEQTMSPTDCRNAEGDGTSVSQTNHSTRIVGGHDAERCELTYQVSLQNIENYPGIIYCGGTIIDKNWILTAGHCVYNDISHPEYFQVTTGEYEVSANDGTEQTFNVSKIYVHEKYNPESLSHDIALLELSTPIQFDECSSKIPLQKANHTTSGNCTISGWGNVQESGMPSNTLQRATVPIISQEECKQIPGYEQLIDDSMICTGFLTGGTDSCYGDSGGPLVCNKTGTSYLAGVVSWGIGCATKGFPGVYQDVSKHIEWIEQTMSPADCRNAEGDGTSVGQPNHSTRIVGGYDAERCELTYQVRLQNFKNYPVITYCGGSIIEQNWILTAGHCVYNDISHPEYFEVTTGEHEVFVNDGTEQTFSVSRIYVHEKFNPDGPERFSHDIALLELSTPIQFDECSNKITLPKANHTTSGNCTVSGWGNVQEGGMPSSILQRATVPIISQEECKQIPEWEQLIDDSMICAGFLTGRIGTCNGDSGGPLVCNNAGTNYLAGVVSWGRGCAREGFPGVYQDVSKHTEWIEHIMSPADCRNAEGDGTSVGQPNHSTRIVEGHDAERCELPYQVRLQNIENYPVITYCGGSIIEQNWILTAGHCVYNDISHPEYFEVTTGEHEVFVNDGTEQTFSVSKIYVHEKYNPDGPERFSHDIALLELSTPIQFDECSNKITLPKANHTTSGNCTVSGWGRVQEGGRPSSILQRATVPIISQEECKQACGYKQLIDDSMICAGFLTGRIGVCNGDSGGPLVCNNAGTNYLAGVVSWSRGCAREEFPGVYQDVSKHIEWIEHTMSPADCRNAEGDGTSVGQPNHSTRIVGGHDAERCELTYQVSLQNIENYPGIIYCGGSIIDKNWILTAGHCVYNDISHPEYFKVTTGEHEVFVNDGTEQTFSVSKIYVHEKYNPESLSDDIALLELSTPIQFDECSNKITLPKANQTTSGNCTVSGWGNVQEGGRPSSILKRATVPIISQEECKQVCGYKQSIDDSMICAGFLTGRIGVCHGDSGGPLVCNNAGTNYLAGVVSWSRGCAREGFPGVYQDVSKHTEWIEHTMSPADCRNAEGDGTSVGQPNHSTRIVEGHDAERCELPYQVRLQNIENYPVITYCGGSIIEQNWILTAGHCVYNDISHPEYLEVTTGEHEVFVNDGTEQTFSVSKIYVHEKYNPESLSDDIALLELSTPIQFDECSNKITLPKANQTTSGNCTVSGWGNVQEGGRPSSILQRATVPIISQEECKQVCGYKQLIDDSMICAGFLTGRIGVCNGDSGGPLVCNNYLAGVVSWGRGCAREGFPGVYQDVSKHIEWIEHKMNNGVDSVNYTPVLLLIMFIVI